MSKEQEIYLGLYQELLTDFEAFKGEAERGADVKTAAARARKLSVSLGKNLTNFRKLSVANDKAK